MKKYFVDAALLIIFLLTMSLHLLPRLLHEVFGLTMLALLAWHLILNRRWLANLFRGNRSRRKIFSTLINFSMLIAFVIILVTGIFISNYIFHDLIPLDLRRNVTIRQLHVALPYIMMILTGLHFGLHLYEILQRLKNFLHIKIFSARQKICGYIFLAAVICLGVYGSFLNQIGDRILMKHIFATHATQLPIGAFWILFLSTMAIYSAIGFLLDRKFLH